MRLVLLLAAACIFFGCSKTEEPPAPPFVSFLKMDVDGIAVENDSYIRASAKRLNYSLLSVAANLKPYAPNANAIEWRIFDFQEAPGEYAIPGPAGTIRDITLFQKEATFAAKSGKITVVEVDQDFIKGSFEFITYVEQITGIQKTVTNGRFHIQRPR